MDKKLTTGKIVGLSLLGILVLLVLWSVGSYNTLVSLDESAKTAQADIEVQYQRRFDLIPNLVATVQSAAQVEKSIYDNIAEARTRYANAPSGTADKVAAANQAESALSRLLVVAENYPQVRSLANFQSLQDQLEGSENRIAVSRNNYNAVVNDLNVRLRRFPTNIIGGMFNFAERARFEVTNSAAKDAPKVDIQVK